jgi:hypothetical protein
MIGLTHMRSLGGKIVLVGFVVALAGLGTDPVRVDADDPTPPPSLFELMKTPTPSAEEAMNDALREGLATPRAATKDCAHPKGSMKKRLSISTALKSACVDRKPDHEAAPTTEDRPSPEKR